MDFLIKRGKEGVNDPDFMSPMKAYLFCYNEENFWNNAGFHWIQSFTIPNNKTKVQSFSPSVPPSQPLAPFLGGKKFKKWHVPMSWMTCNIYCSLKGPVCKVKLHLGFPYELCCQGKNTALRADPCSGLLLSKKRSHIVQPLWYNMATFLQMDLLLM